MVQLTHRWLSRVGLVQLTGASFLVIACAEHPIVTPRENEGPIAIRKLAGDNQTDTVFSTLRVPLQVQVFRAPTNSTSGDVAVNAVVRWQPEDQSAELTTTDAAGIASYVWALGSNVGSRRVTAQVTGFESLVVPFNAYVTGGRPVGIRNGHPGVIDSQTGIVGAKIVWDYEVYALDRHGNTAVGPLVVDWKVTAGGGSIVDVCGPECWCPVPVTECNSQVFARHVLGQLEGPNAVTATASQLNDTPVVSFGAVGVTAYVEVRDDGTVRTTANKAFVPDSVEISAGRTVGWMWVGDYHLDHLYLFEKHNLVFEDDPSESTSSEPKNEGIHTRRFTAAGKYRYRCTLHAGEVGVVSVVPTQTQ